MNLVSKPGEYSLRSKHVLYKGHTFKLTKDHICFLFKVCPPVVVYFQPFLNIGITTFA